MLFLLLEMVAHALLYSVDCIKQYEFVKHYAPSENQVQNAFIPNVTVKVTGSLMWCHSKGYNY